MTLTIRILTNADPESKFIYTVHLIANGTHTTRPPRPLEAENWAIPDYP